MLDSFDRRILALLQADADRPISAVGERVGLSVSACSRRIQRLREEGVITRNVTLLDRRSMGVPTTVFVLVRCGCHAAGWVDAFRATIADLPEIVEAHRLTGNFDYMLKLVLPNVEYYDLMYKHLTLRLELRDITAYISIDTLKEETALPIGHAQ